MYLLSKGCWGINFWILHNNQVSTSVRAFSELQKLLMCSWLWVLLWLWLLWRPGGGLSVITWPVITCWLSHCGYHMAGYHTVITWLWRGLYRIPFLKRSAHLIMIIRPTTNQPTQPPTNQPKSYIMHKNLKNITRTHEPTTLKPFHPKSKKMSLIQECRFGECRIWEGDQLSSFISSQVYVLISYSKYIWEKQFNPFA